MIFFLSGFQTAIKNARVNCCLVCHLYLSSRYVYFFVCVCLEYFLRNFLAPLSIKIEAKLARPFLKFLFIFSVRISNNKLEHQELLCIENQWKRTLCCVLFIKMNIWIIELSENPSLPFLKLFLLYLFFNL